MPFAASSSEIDNDGRIVHREKRYGDLGRNAVRRASVGEALEMIELLASGGA